MRRLVVTVFAILGLLLPLNGAGSLTADGACLVSDGEGLTVLRLRSDGRPTSALVRVPDTGRVVADVAELVLLGPDGESAPTDGLDTDALVAVSEPAIMRDLRLVAVTLLPEGRGLPENVVAATATVRIANEPGRGVNERTGRTLPLSPAFDRIYRETVLNYNGSGLGRAFAARANWSAGSCGRDLEGARYVIVADPTFQSVADSLAAHKRLKGLLPVVATPPGGVWTRYEIHEYMQNAYENWDVPPEYLLLLGDTQLIPTGGGTIRSDNYYADLEGDDYLLDILVGRLTADDIDDAEIMLAKTLAYERPWLHDDSVWPAAAALIVREDEMGGNEIYYENSAFIRGLMEGAGFSAVDTLFTRNWSTAGSVYSSLAQGRGYLNYRGSAGAFWIPPFQVLPWDMEPMWELPIVVSATCLTGDYYGDESMCEFFLGAGDMLEPKGCVAFFATSTAGLGPELSQKRAWVDEGFFAHVFAQGRTLGEACAAGKTNLYTNSQDVPEYQGWNLLGDPELTTWTARAAELQLEHDPAVSENETIEVTVLDGRAPVEGAVVTADVWPLAFSLAVTDSAGRAALPLTAAAPCTVRLAVVAKDARPAGAEVLVLAEGPHLLFAGEAVDDSDGGNGDGLASPGESVRLSVGFRNLGNATADAVIARLVCPDPYVSVTDSVASFDSILPDSTVWSQSSFTLDVSEDWPGAYSIPLEVEVTCDDTTTRVELPRLETVTGDLTVYFEFWDDRRPGGDGDGALEPGEVVGLGLTLDCTQSHGLVEVEGVLESRNPGVTVTAGESEFTDAHPSAHCSVERTPFVVQIAPDADPGDALLFLRVTGQAPEYAYAETLKLGADVAEVPLLHPTGPDAYGYYAYDSTDSIYVESPRFEWTELRPPGPGVLVSEISDASNEVVNLEAPFTVRHYGINLFDLSICSNGFVSLHDTDFRWGGNSGIPDLHGAAGMLAPFWDDLDPAAGGDVYAWHDTVGHRYLVEYDEVAHAGSDTTETFQVVIHDPEHHPTPTEDAPILFLYKNVGSPQSCTVGIENLYQTVGTQFLFDGDYGDYAAPLEDSLAILFTTAEPESLRFPWLVLEDFALDDSEGGNGDGHADPGEQVELTVSLWNGGPVEAEGLELRLSTTAPEVAIADGSAPLAGVPSDSIGENTDDPFVLSVHEAAGDTAVTMWISFGPESNTRQGAVRLDLPVGGEPVATEPRLALGPSHPNPFASATVLSFSVPGPGRVTARVYDVAGRLVKTLVDSRLEAGPGEVQWDGRNADGRTVASGVYFVRVEAGGDSRTRKIVLLR